MSNPMKYIKALEAVGFARNQAEAQVQMVLDALEGELVTKADLGVLKSDMDQRFANIDARFLQVDARFAQVDSRFDRMEERFERRLIETEFRLLTRLGFLMVSTTTIAVAVLTWLIKI